VFIVLVSYLIDRIEMVQTALYVGVHFLECKVALVEKTPESLKSRFLGLTSP